MPSNRIIQKRNGSVLDGYEERIKELYNSSTLAQLKATIDEEAKQKIPESQYRGKIRQLGLRKYRKASETNSLASALQRRPTGSNVFLRGKQLSQDEVRRIKARSRPGIFTQLNSHQIPEGYAIRSPTPEQTENYAANIPFLEFENAVQRFFDGSRYQHLHGSVGIAPQLLRDQTNPPASHLASMVDAWDPVTLNFNNPRALVLLGAIMPPSSTHPVTSINFPSRHDVNIANLSLRRQFLFSIANNFAGIDRLPSWRQLDLLQDVSCDMIYQLFQLTKGPTARSIAQSLFKASIESDRHTTIHALLSVEAAGINVNKEKIVIHDTVYTPVQRASVLRRRETIKALMQHGADVNSWAVVPKKERLRPGDSPLACAVTHRSLDRHREGPLDIETFKLLSKATRAIHMDVISSLIEGREEDYLLYLMQEQFEKFAAYRPYGGRIIAPTYKVLEVLSEENALTVIPALIIIRGRPGLLDDAAYRGYVVLAEKLISDFGFYPDGPTIWLALSGRCETIVRKLLPLTSPSIHTDYNFFTPFSSAIMTGDENIIKFVRDSGASEYLHWDSVFTLAWNAAIRQGNAEIIDELLHLHHDPPIICLEYLLKISLREGNYRFAEELLTRGVAIPDWELQPKIISNYPGYHRFSQRLRDAGVELYGSTDLIDFQASREPPRNRPERIDSVGLPELVSLLLDFSLDVRLYLPEIFRIATSRADYSLVRRIFAEGNQFRLCSHILVVALEQSDEKLIDIILEAGASTKWCHREHRDELPFLDDDRFRAFGGLRKTATMGDDHMTKYLLRRGADPNDSRALEAAFKTNRAVFETILTAYKRTYGFRVKTFGSSLLILAVKNKDTALIEVLLEHNVDPHGLDDTAPFENHLDVSPFGYAIVTDNSCNFTIVERFLNHGCCATDIVSRLSFQITELMGNDNYTSVFVNNGGYRITAFLAAVTTENIELVQLLARCNEAVVRAPARGSIKRTALQRAAEIGSFKMVKFIHDLGADINEPPNPVGGATALQLAAIGGFGQIVCYLIEHGADVNAPAALRDGMMALVGAAARGRIDIVAILLNKGAARGEDGAKQFELAIKKAKRYGYYPTCDYLQQRWDAQQRGALQLPDPMDEFIVDLSDED